MTHSSFPASDQRSAKPFDKVHMDLKSMPMHSYRGYNFFLIFFDDCTSHGWTVNLKHKSDANLAIRQFIAKIRTQYGKTIHEFQINAGGEFKSKELTEFLKELGVNILTSVPHMHQQNGRVERFIRTIMDKSQENPVLRSPGGNSLWIVPSMFTIVPPLCVITGRRLLKTWSTQNLM
jgi:transposase InsO family protein